jgi:hypothetical protein
VRGNGGEIRTLPLFKGGRNVRDSREIDSWLRHIWVEIVKKEYDSSRILEESNLHSTVYPVRNNTLMLCGGVRL